MSSEPLTVDSQIAAASLSDELSRAHTQASETPLHQAQMSDAIEQQALEAQIEASWRTGCAHLSRSPSGLWYMRLKVPQAMRDAYPHLPKELRRSTKTHHRCHALGISRKMCIDFFIRHKFLETTAMSQPDKELENHTVQDGLTISIRNGQVHFQGLQTDPKNLSLAIKLLSTINEAMSANDAQFVESQPAVQRWPQFVAQVAKRDLYP